MIVLKIVNASTQHVVVSGNEPFRVEYMKDAPTYAYAGFSHQGEGDPDYHTCAVFDPDNKEHVNIVSLARHEFDSVRLRVSEMNQRVGKKIKRDDHPLFWLQDKGLSKVVAERIVSEIQKEFVRTQVPNFMSQVFGHFDMDSERYTFCFDLNVKLDNKGE